MTFIVWMTLENEKSYMVVSSKVLEDLGLSIHYVPYHTYYTISKCSLLVLPILDRLSWMKHWVDCSTGLIISLPPPPKKKLGSGMETYLFWCLQTITGSYSKHSSPKYSLSIFKKYSVSHWNCWENKLEFYFENSKYIPSMQTKEHTCSMTQSTTSYLQNVKKKP